MHPTTPLRVPVLTFLSRSPSASRKSLRLLEKLTSVEPLSGGNDSSSSSSSSSPQRDGLDASVFSSALLNKHSFDSAASICPNSAVIIHLLSISDGQEQQTKSDTSDNFLSLLSLTDDGSSYDNAEKSLQHSRDFIAKNVKGGGGMVLGAQLAMRTGSNGRYPVEAHHLVLDGHELPKLDLSCLPQYEHSAEASSAEQRHGESKSNAGIIRIRELVIPTFDSSLQSQLSSCAALSRPKVGLYRWPGKDANANHGIVTRPLPSAAEDRELSPPSIVFQCDSLETSARLLRESEDGNTTKTALAKVGFSGCGTGGQYMIRNALLDGLDVRFCEATELSSAFAEAQEALLAASLDELQSVNVMNEGSDDRKPTNTNEGGGKSQEGGSDAMNGLGDCWVEFRANVKKPGGFFGRKGGIAGGSRRKPEVAKAPDIPYE